MKVRILSGGGSSGQTRLYLAWLICKTAETICSANETQEDASENVDTFRGAWYSVGGKYTERSTEEKRKDIRRITDDLRSL